MILKWNVAPVTIKKSWSGSVNMWVHKKHTLVLKKNAGEGTSMGSIKRELHPVRSLSIAPSPTSVLKKQNKNVFVDVVDFVELIFGGAGN